MFQHSKGTPSVSFPYTKIAVAALVVIAAFALGMIFGQNRAKQPITLEDGQVIGIGELRTLSEDVDFQLFWEVWTVLQEDYLRGPVAEKDLFYSALEGLVAGAGDPYSVFFDPRAASEFQSDLSGTFEGIGAEIGMREDQLIVVAPLRDAPAERAGLMAGDAILAIDEFDTTGITVDEAVQRIRGPRNSEVVLTIYREDTEELKDITVTRGVIEISSVEWEVRDDGVAVISLHFFNEDTSRKFNEAVVEVTRAGATGLVLDLRNNPGGLLDRAVTVAGEWIGAQTVVLERDEEGVLTALNAQGVARLSDLPTVVLVNGGSASASEIVAGALQDYEKATVIGTQTFGKGSVQEYREFTDGSALKVTIAEWVTPLGRSIDQEGIAPDEVVEITREDLEEERDPQLERALELLTN